MIDGEGACSHLNCCSRSSHGCILQRETVRVCVCVCFASSIGYHCLGIRCLSAYIWEVRRWLG